MEKRVIKVADAAALGEILHFNVVESPTACGAGEGGIRVFVDREGILPKVAVKTFDLLLTSAPNPPRPWVYAEQGIDGELALLTETVTIAPNASAILVDVLRIVEHCDFASAVQVEALAYSTLLGAAEFAAWRRRVPVRTAKAADAPRVRLERCDETLLVTLTRGDQRNAFDAAMRDALCEALMLPLSDPSITCVRLCGEGPCFSAGGDLDEFGRAGDVAQAYRIRKEHAPTRLIHQLGDRASAHLHGACVGAGIEIPAAASFVTARSDTVARLPEIRMGLIPGAGGTVSIPRRIGRHRTCYMALAGRAIDATTALRWGLCDQLVA